MTDNETLKLMIEALDLKLAALDVKLDALFYTVDTFSHHMFHERQAHTEEEKP